MACETADQYARSTGALKLWTPDVCANVLFVAARRPPAHAEEGVTPEPILAVPVSLHAVRAVAVAGLTNQDEPCKMHYGRVARGPDGPLARVYFCSKPSPSVQRTGMARAARGVGPLDTPLGGALGAYETPHVAEALLGAGTSICGGFY